MIPWPIALLSLFYGAIATCSVVAAWNILTGRSHQLLIWALVWLGVSGGAMCGLPLLKSWARHLAIFGSTVMAVLVLAVAGLLVMSGRPLGGLVATLAAGIHVLIIRYLRRPAVKAWFEPQSAVGSQRTIHRKSDGENLLR